MANPILQAANQSRMGNMRSMIQGMKNAGNPQALMNQMLRNNPQYNQVMQIVKVNGGDPKTAFYATARQMGVDGDEIINMFK